MWYEKLKIMKEKSGFTTEEISLKSKVPIGTLNKIFANQTKNPKLETIKSIVKVLGYTLDDLSDLPKKNKIDAPEELKEIGVEWIELSKNAIQSGLTPEDVQQIIDVINRKKLR
jgi:transcriptional regulator with XRE-family HTH domain